MNNAQLRRAAEKVGSSINILKSTPDSNNRVLMGGLLFRKIADTEYLLSGDESAIRDLSDIMIGTFKCPRLDIDSTFKIFDKFNMDKTILFVLLSENKSDSFFCDAMKYALQFKSEGDIEEAVRGLFKYKLS